MDTKVPTLTSEQMREVDDLMMKYYGIDVLQMMEHDARGLTEVAKEMLRGSLRDKRVVVFAGKSGNGAGGLTAGRHLHNAGASVQVVLAAAERSLNKEGKHHLKTLKKIGIRIHDSNFKLKFHNFDLVLDALLGYSSEGDPRPPFDELILDINEIQRQGAKVLSNDLPSGLDVVSGLPHKPCVKADVTMTVALPKVGLLQDIAREWVGELYIADIGAPPELYAKMGLQVPENLFEEEWIIKI